MKTSGAQTWIMIDPKTYYVRHRQAAARPPFPMWSWRSYMHIFSGMLLTVYTIDRCSPPRCVHVSMTRRHELFWSFHLPTLVCHNLGCRCSPVAARSHKGMARESLVTFGFQCQPTLAFGVTTLNADMHRLSAVLAARIMPSWA